MEKINKNYIYYIALIVSMVLLKLASSPISVEMPYYEMLDELYLLDRSLYERVMQGGANYINFLLIFIAYLVIKVFNIIEYFPIVSCVIATTVGAVSLSIILHKKFEEIIPDFNFRLAILICLYLFPMVDMTLYYNQSYYVFLLPVYYYLLFSEGKKLSNLEIIIMIVLAPLFVFGKPVFFVFGVFFAYLFVMQVYNFIVKKINNLQQILCLVYINFLYAFQAWFSLIHRPLVESKPIEIVWMLNKTIDFMGFYFVNYFAKYFNADTLKHMEFFVGILVSILLLYAIYIVLKNKLKMQYMLLLYMIAGCIVTMLGSFNSSVVYDLFYLSESYYHWGARTIFPFMVLALLAITFSAQNLKSLYKNFIVSALMMLCVFGLLTKKPTRFEVDFPWSKTISLLEERNVYLPSATSHKFYFSREIYFFEWDMPAILRKNKTLEIQHSVGGRHIMYVVFAQKFDTKSFGLLPTDRLEVEVDGHLHQAKLINPGRYGRYLFKFPSFIPSEKLQNLKIKSDESNMHDTEVKVSFIGN